MEVDVQDSPIEPQLGQHDPDGSVTPPVQLASKSLPLAPLEYLQNQRRGSITDPFLHAHLHPTSKDASPKPPSLSIHPPPERDFPSRTKSAPLVIRPSSPYVFGDATSKPTQPQPQPHQPADNNLRRLLHPTPPAMDLDVPFQRPSSSSEQASENGTRAMSGPPEQSNQHITADHRGQWLHDEPDSRDRPKHRYGDIELVDRLPSDLPAGFDWGMRRHSIAAGASVPQAFQPRSRRDPASRSRLKRKMSSERHSGEDDDGEPHDAGLPSGTDARLGSLSLYDRRETPSSSYLLGSSHSSPHQLWDRRDSVTSTFSNLSSAGGYPSSAVSGDSPKSVAPHPWINLPPVSIGDKSIPTLHLDQRSLSHHPHPPMPNGFDRRLSVPEITTRAVADHGLRRVRPRTDARETVLETDHKDIHTSTNELTNSERANSSSSPKLTNITLVPPSRDGGAPYSRSPELRVSHKLAERKRRKEMKELFDELREQLPADRSMKSSKWEILSKAIDHIVNLTATLGESQRQVELLRIELEKTRDPHYSHITNPPIVQSQGPTTLPPYPPGRTGEAGLGTNSASTPSGLRSGATNPYTLPSGGQPPLSM